jgi:endonuclease I
MNKRHWLIGVILLAIFTIEGCSSDKKSEETPLPNDNGGQSYTGYYQDASSKTGIELKKALTTITTNGYKAKSYADLWSAYKEGDIRTDGTGAIWDIYSDTPSKTPPYYYQPGQDQCGNYSGEGHCYNREHTIPKSWFNDDSPMISDYLHILPTDGYVNGKRSNYPYGEVGTATWTSKNGSKLGTAKSTLGYGKTVFEPIDAYKGDIARIYFYFVTRYADKLKTYDANGTEEVFNASDYGLDPWTISMMVRWNNADPVSEKEKKRNEEAQTFQGNRNPFVDHPEFVAMIWGKVASKSNKR